MHTAVYAEIARLRENIVRELVERGWITDPVDFQRDFEKRFECAVHKQWQSGQCQKADQRKLPNAADSAPLSTVEQADYDKLTKALGIVACLSKLTDIEPVNGMLRQSKKIDALKELRRQTNFGLREAKQTVDCLAIEPLGDRVWRLLCRRRKAGAVKLLLGTLLQ
jgi:hypothetical protein